MKDEDRRRAPRHDVKLPVKLRPTEGTTPYAHSAESVNVSERGLYFSIGGDMKAGTTVELSFTMPGEVTGGLPMKIRCTARIVRVDARPGSDNKVGVAAHIERFETVVAEM